MAQDFPDSPSKTNATASQDSSENTDVTTPFPSDELDHKEGTIVFLLGAGCSVDCGSPLMSGFMRRALELQQRDCLFKQDYDEAFQFKAECMSISYFVDRWWDNIEDLFTQAHMRLLLGMPGADSVYKSIARVIWDVYRRHSTGENQGLRLLAYLLRALSHKWKGSDGPRPVVVTTNYDVNLEGLLLHAPSANPNWPHEIPTVRVAYDGAITTGGITSARKGIFPDRIRNSVIEVIKLHGSVNWFRQLNLPEHESVAPAFIDTGIDAEPKGSRYAIFSSQLDRFAAGNVVSRKFDPLIIPPLLGKTSLSPMIQGHWRRARHALEVAREIIFIGYSFPETDTFMTRLLAEGLRKNRELDRITIINSDIRDIWWNRVEEIFSRSWWTNAVTAKRVDLYAGALEMCTQRLPKLNFGFHLASE